MDCAIIGGGIGGLFAALALHARGVDVEVFEASREIRPLGVGINLLPHAVRELSAVGLESALRETAIETAALMYVNRFGSTIWSEPRGRAAGYDWPQLSIHRGEMQMLLYRTAIERLGAERIHVAHTLQSFASTDTEVTLQFSLSNGGTREVRAPIAIGADGIHSVVRRTRYPEEGPARYSGRILWRATSLTTPYLDGRTMFMAGHQDQKFVSYPISEQRRREGASLVNWIAELAVPGATPAREDWNRRVEKDVFAAAFADWRFPWVDIPALIDSAEAIYEFPMVDRDPCSTWLVGRIAMLGDAAHAMYPIGSNGASQAILDGRCLADCLERFADPLYALREYEAERLPRTAAIVLRNRLNGPEQVMQLAHERAPNGFTDIDAVVPRQELQEIALRYKKLAGFDPATVNAGSDPAVRSKSLPDPDI